MTSRLTTSNRDRSPSSSSSSSHSRSNGSRPLPDNPPSRMFTHNRLIHGPCAQTRITLKTQGYLLECPKCANSHASYPENDQELQQRRRTDRVRDDYPDSAYDSSNPSGYLSASNGRLRSSSESDHYHDRRGRRSRHQAYDPPTSSNDDDNEYDSDLDNQTTSGPHSSSSSSSSSSSKRRGKTRTPADSNGSDADCIIDRHTRGTDDARRAANEFRNILTVYREHYVNQDTQDKLGSEYQCHNRTCIVLITVI